MRTEAASNSLTSPTVALGRKLALNYGLLLGGEMLAKVGSFVAFTYLARTLGPSGYGALEFTVALMIFFSLVIAGGMDEYGTRELARGEVDPKQLAGDVIVLRTLMMGISLLGLLALVWGMIQSTQEALLILTFGASLILAPVLPQWFFQGHERMSWIGGLSAVRQAVFALLVLFLFTDKTPLYRLGLFECTAVGVVVALGAFGLRRSLGFSRPAFSFDAARLWRRFVAAAPISLSHVTWAGLWHFPTLVLGLWGTSAALGLFGAAHRITIALHTFVWLYFVNLLPSISRAVRADRDTETGTTANLLQSSLHVTAWSGFFVALVGIVCSGIVIRLAFGSQFTLAAPILSILILVIPATLISGNFRYVLIAADKQRDLFLCSLQASIATAILAAVLIPVFGGIGAACALLGGSVLLLIQGYFVAAKCIEGKLNIRSSCGRPAIVFAFSLLLFAALKSMNVNPLLAIGVPPALFLAILFILERKFLTETLPSTLRLARGAA